MPKRDYETPFLLECLFPTFPSPRKDPQPPKSRTFAVGLKRLKPFERAKHKWMKAKRAP